MVVGRNPEILIVYGITGLKNNKNKIKKECEIKIQEHFKKKKIWKLTLKSAVFH